MSRHPYPALARQRGPEPAELLILFGPQGERIHVRGRSTRPELRPPDVEPSAAKDGKAVRVREICGYGTFQPVRQPIWLKTIGRPGITISRPS